LRWRAEQHGLNDGGFERREAGSPAATTVPSWGRSKRTSDARARSNGCPHRMMPKPYSPLDRTTQGRGRGSRGPALSINQRSQEAVSR